LHTTDFMTMFQITILVRILYLEISVITKQLITRSNINVITIKGDATQSTVGAASFEVDVAGIPVDHLCAFALVKVNDIRTTVTFALLAAPDD